MKMNNDVLSIKFINVKNCFLHLSVQCFNDITGPSVCGLKIVTTVGKEVYLSASPVPCHLVSGKSAGVSHVFAKILGLQDNEDVVVSPIYNLGSLQSISVTPKTTEDFEILHSTALAVESSLLNQLRIVWPNQEFPVWVSANISVRLVVDNVSPNLKFGRLEEYSEVVVANTVLESGENLNSKQGINEFDNIADLKETEIKSKVLKFRCVPLKNVSIRNKTFLHNPYIVFVKKSKLPSWIKSIVISNAKKIWKLKKIEQEFPVAYVTLYLCEEEELIGEDICDYKSIFISSTLRQFLGLTLGQKVLLELDTSSSLVDVSGILISSEGEGQENEDKLSNEVREVFSEAVSSYGFVLLNTKAPYPLKDSNIVLTLRPLHAEWGLITSGKLNCLSINVNKFISEKTLDSYITNRDQDATPKTVISSYQDAFEQGRISTELSLGVFSEKSKKRVSDNTIFVGQNGCGKTELLKTLLKKIEGPPYYIYSKFISCCSLKGKRIEAFSKILTEALQLCGACEPSVLFLDDIDLLTSTKEENTEAAFHINRVSYKIVELLEAYQKKHYICILATAKSTDFINPKIFCSKGRCLFTSVIKLPDFENNDREELIKQIISVQYGLEAVDLDFSFIASQTEAYTAIDLRKLCERAVFEGWQRKVLRDEKLVVTNKDFKHALENSTPSALQQVHFYKSSKTSFKDIGGLNAVKEKLIEVVCWPTLYPEILKQCPVKSQNGVLIYGAPGTGKTLLASALASESHMNFISIKGPELMSKYIGESEEGVRKLFEKAQTAKPCLLFFDEFDSLAPRRGQDQTGVTDRVVNQLLTALDGVNPVSGVWIIAATSRPDLIDPAVLRPGRIGISIRCPLPDKTERLEILNVICSKVSVSNDVEIKEIADISEGFTGADLKGLFTSAQIKAIDNLQSDEGLFDEDVFLQTDKIPVIELQKKHLMAVLNEMKPSLSESDRSRYESIYTQFERREPMKVKQQKVTLA